MPAWATAPSGRGAMADSGDEALAGRLASSLSSRAPEEKGRIVGSRSVVRIMLSAR